MKRVIHHDPGSILNVMTIELDGDSETKPHFNKDRDELIFVLEGDLKLSFDHQKSILISSNDVNPWHLIKANTTHQLNCVTKKVKILEVIGGIHKDDSCVITEFQGS